MARFEINVSVNGQASIKSLDDSLKSVENNAKTTSKSVDGLSSSFKTLGGIIAGIGMVELGRKTIQTADTMNLLEGRLSLVVKQSKDLAIVQKELFNIAQNSRQGLEATYDLYTRVARATENLGKSQKQVLEVTNIVNKAMVVSGTSAMQAEAAIMQLGQALGSGALQGDELRSILENAPRLAQAIADGMGIQIGQLKKLGADGQLTSEKVFDALSKSGQKIEEEFGRMPKTVGQSITQIENSIMSLVGTTDDAVNGTGGIGDTLSYIAKYIDNNRGSIVEFGRDFYRSLQLMGAGALTALKGVEVLINGFMGGITGAVEIALNTLVMFVNGAIASAEFGYNKIRSLGGLDQKSLNRMKQFDLGSKSYFKEMTSDANEFNNVGLKTMGKLFDEIANNTTVIKTNVGELSGAGGKKSISQTGMSDKEREKAEKARLKAIEDEHKARVDAMADINKATANAQKYDDYQLKVIEDKAKAEKAMYAELLKLNDDWYTADSIKLGEQYNEWEKAGVDKVQLQEWLNAEILSLDEKRIKEQKDAEEKLAKEQAKYWDDIFSDFEKAMDNQIFDAMTKKWTNFGDWLKDFWSSITTSIARTISSQLSGSIVNSIKSSLSGKSEAGFLDSMFKTTSSIIGGSSILSADSIKSLGATTDSAGFTTTLGGTVLDAGGQVTKSGSDLTDVLYALSSAKSAYSLGINGMLYAPSAYMGQLAGTAYGAGFTGTGSFLAGGANVLAGGGVQGLSGAAYAGGLATAGIAGGIGGYAMGSIGDKLLGTSTKAGSYGAIGGSLGAIIGSVVPGLGTMIGGVVGSALGSLIGGAFGSKKVKDSGLYFAKQSASANVEEFVMSFVDMQKKSWFKSSSWTDYKALSTAEKAGIKGIFDTYDYLLGALGDSDKIFLQAGKYSGQTFLDQLAKNFISVIKTGGDTTEIYNAWVDYAKQIGITVQEAFGKSISDMITASRSFSEWKLGSGTVDQLSFTMEYLVKDFNALASSMGASSVNVDNFSRMYDSAIKANFTPENIAKWTALGQSLMSATDATEAYNDALEAQQKSYEDMITNSMSGIATALANVNDIAIKTINVFKSLKDSTQSLRDSLSIGQSSNSTTAYYLAQFQDIKKEFLSNFDSSGMALAGNLEKMQSDYAKLTGTMGSLGNVSPGTKSALLGELNVFGAMFDKNAQALQVMIVGDETGSASESTLTNVEQWIKSLYAVQEQVKIAETAPLSSASFQAGHTLGTQEKIDFAKKTGLTIGSDSFNKAISDIQGFSTQSDDLTYLKTLGSTSLKAIGSLGSTSPSDASAALDTYIKNSYNDAIAEYNSAVISRQREYDALMHLKTDATWTGHWTDLIDKASMDTARKYGFAIEGNGTLENWIKMQDIQDKADSLPIPSKPSLDQFYKSIGNIGFAVGTPNVPYDMTANIHKGEIIVPQTFSDGLRKGDLTMGGSGLFKDMANELKQLRSEMSNIKGVMMSQLREVINGNVLMRQVTNGGNAMMVEVV